MKIVLFLAILLLIFICAKKLISLTLERIPFNREMCKRSPSHLLQEYDIDNDAREKILAVEKMLPCEFCTCQRTRVQCFKGYLFGRFFLKYLFRFL